MGGITMWIILGSLVGVVAIFLVVASILDRKKAKKAKAARAELKKATDGARGNVAASVNKVIDENSKLLKDFVPSVGKVKMSEIRDKARKALDEIEKSKEFKLAKDSDENKDLITNFGKLKEANSNTWETKSKKVIEFFKEAELKANEEPSEKTEAAKSKKNKNKKAKGTK